MIRNSNFAVVAIALLALSHPALGDLVISFGESTPGSATVQESVGGTAVIGVFARSEGVGIDSFDSFDLFIDVGFGEGVGRDGTDAPTSGFSFDSPPVDAATVFTNADRNVGSAATSPLAMADIQVSADRSSFMFGATPTKLFDLNVAVDASVPAGMYTVQARDDSGFLMAFNEGGTNQFADSPGSFRFEAGQITVSAVPEPSSFLFCGLVACAFTGVRLWKKNKLWCS